MEQKKAIEAELEGRSYTFILDASYQWANWVAPKTADGKFDHNNAAIGDDLKDLSTLSCSPTLKALSSAPLASTPLNTKLVRFLVRLTTNCKVATTYSRW